MIQQSFKCGGVLTKMDDFEDHSIFNFEKVSGKKSTGIGIEEEEKNNEILDDDSNSECEYYENEEENYVNIWD